jgi:hypothetical protein
MPGGAFAFTALPIWVIEVMSYYRLGLYLSAAIVVWQLLFFLYLLPYGYETASKAIIGIVVPLVITFGLWLLSKAARYVGAIWFVFAAAMTSWPLFMGGKINVWPVFGWGLALAALSLAAAWLLLFSRQYGKEFAERRDAEPKYKALLRRIAITVIVILALIATANDIQHLLDM